MFVVQSKCPDESRPGLLNIGGAWEKVPLVALRKGAPMTIRYMGFEQQQSLRSYRFDVTDRGQPTRQFIVIADISLFPANHVGIQEGPQLCATKLAADLERQFDGAHELTVEDLRSHSNARVMAEAQRAATRKPIWRHRSAEEE